MRKTRPLILLVVFLTLTLSVSNQSFAQGISYNPTDNVTSTIDTGTSDAIELKILYGPSAAPATQNGNITGSGTVNLISNDGGVLNLRGDNRSFTGYLYLRGGGINLADDNNLIGAMGNIVFSYSTGGSDPVVVGASDLRVALGQRVAAGLGGDTMEQLLAPFQASVDQNIGYGSLGYIQIDAAADVTVSGNQAAGQNLFLDNGQAGRIEALAGSTLTYDGHYQVNGGGLCGSTRPWPWKWPPGMGPASSFPTTARPTAGPFRSTSLFWP